MSARTSNSNLVSEDAAFEEAIMKYGSRKCFLIGLFLLCSSPGIINGFHVMTYIFFGNTPRHWCSISELEKANWTTDNILKISSPNPARQENCVYYKRNYSLLSRMSFQEAFKKIKSEKRPQVIECERFSYEMDPPSTSIVAEWDMVCNFLAKKATVQAALSVGKLLGALIFGSISDRFGRTVSFRSACLIYILAGPVVAYGKFYNVMVIARVCLGIAASSIYESAFAIVSETCQPELRSTLGVMFNQSYPLGMIMIAIIAYFVRNWKNLQMLISLLAFSLIFHTWVIPESPRWLYYSGRKGRAWKMLSKFHLSENREQQSVSATRATSQPENPQNRLSLSQRISSRIAGYFRFFKFREFIKRLLICWFIWCSTATAYNSLSISAESLHVNPYIFGGLSGVAEAVSYILTTLLLEIVGRRNATSFLLITAATLILCLMVIPSDFENYTLGVALLGRLSVSGVFCVSIIHAFELFPTVARSRALSSSSMMAHFGSIFAPYLVDFFGKYATWIPETVCGFSLLMAGLLCQALPETRNIPLYNLLEDLEYRSNANPDERVSFKNCAPYAVYKKFKQRRSNENE